jgi:glycosyltransferase involved in cell wall biosynthesis
VIRLQVNGRFLGQRITGAQRYARELLAAVDVCLQADPQWSGTRLTLLVPRETPRPQLETADFRVIGRLRGNLWEQMELPRWGNGGVLLNLSNTAPLLGRNMVTTIHDASVYAVPQAYSHAFRSWYRIMIPLIGRRSRKVVTSSRFSRGELQRYGGIDPARIVVIPGSGEHILASAADSRVFDRLGLGSRPYVLAVSSRSSHKNVGRVVEAMELLGDESMDLVLAGGANQRVFRGPATLSSRRIRAAGYVSDGELRALYEQAGCFVYPSLYEGFGLPPLEAMTCGCPVIASRAASLPEVCGDAALYCDPHDAVDISRGIARVMGNDQLRQDLRQRGLSRATQFRWSDAGRALLQLVQRLDPQ